MLDVIWLKYGVKEIYRGCCEAIKREFGFRVENNVSNDLFSIDIGEKYNVEISRAIMSDLMVKNPYGLDRCILEEIIQNVGDIYKSRSKYIQYYICNIKKPH